LLSLVDLITIPVICFLAVSYNKLHVSNYFWRTPIIACSGSF
jgi:hypothetical protein